MWGFHNVLALWYAAGSIAPRNHVSNILTKLQVSNRTKAAARARGLA